MTDAFITGGSGFVGRHLIDALLKRGKRVAATYFAESEPRDPRVEWHRWSLSEPAALEQILASTKPRHLYHLAGPAHVPTASAHPEQTLQAIVGTALTLSRIFANSAIERVLYVSTGEVYGRPRDDKPFDEEAVPSPTTIYGISKLAASQWYLNTLADRVVVVRPFNQIGPGQSPLFAVGSFARQMAEVALDKIEPVLRVGNLDVVRDFIDVRDSAEAHICALEQGKVGAVYNIASGVGTSLRSLVEEMAKAAGREVTLVVDPDRVRANDAPRIVGSSRLLQADSGWAAKSTPLKGAFDAVLAARDELSRAT